MKSDVPDLERVRSYCAALTQRHPKVGGFYLIGSRAAGRERRDSDWDLILLNGIEVFLDLCDDPLIAVHGIDLFVWLKVMLYGQPWKTPGCDGLRRKELRGELVGGVCWTPLRGASSKARLFWPENRK